VAGALTNDVKSFLYSTSCAGGKITLVPHLVGMMISPLRMLALDSDVCPTPVTYP
jgi:hypothetical protein